MRRGVRRHAFALVTVLATAAFLLVLVLAVAAMLRVSSGVAEYQQLQTDIRAEAWNAAMLGLANLQQLLGEDRAVSAQALGFGNEANTQNARQHVRNSWYMSEDRESSKTEFYATERILGAWDQNGTHRGWLYQGGDSGVWKEMVPGVELELSRGERGLYGWWIADEGLKASASAFVKAEADNLQELNDVRFQLAVAQNMEALLPDAETTNEEIWERNQLLLQDRGFQDGIFTMTELYDEGEMGVHEYDLSHDAERKFAEALLYHRIGVGHVGLLTNPVAGGIKQDMSLNSPKEAQLWIDAEGEKRESGGYRYAITEHVYPVLTSLRMQFILIRKEQEFYLRQRLFVRFWNPYTAALYFRGSPEIRLEVSGLPEQVQIRRQGQVVADIPLRKLVTTVVRLPFSQGEWLPGRTYHWAGLDVQGRSFENAPNMTNNSLQMDYPLGLFPDSGIDLEDTDSDSVEYEVEYSAVNSSAEGMRFTIYVEDPSGWQQTQQITTDKGGMEFSGVRIGPGSIEQVIPDRPVGGDAHVGYRIRMYESGYHDADADAKLRGDWLARHDIRDRTLYALTGPGGHYEYYPDPADLQSVRSEAGLEGADIRRLDTRPLSGPNSQRVSMDFTLFEIPWETPLSVAALQHVHVEGQRPYALGNAWGGVRNSWFDQYYLSGEMQEDGSPLNPRIRHIHGQTGEDLVVEGAFNINCVDAEVWYAVLKRGVLEGWFYWEKDSRGNPHAVRTTALHSWFTRFPQTAAEMFDIGLKTDAASTAVNIPPREYFLRGVREFTDRQIARLAWYISREIRAYHRGEETVYPQGGRPFLSLREFVESNVIGNAIDAAGLNQLSAVEELYAEFAETTWDKALRDDPYSQNFLSQYYDNHADAIWENVPFHLSQADVLTAIDPYLQVRSDTFMIRGYAEKPLQASAMVEVTVQRTYEAYSTGSNPYLRRFVITGIRWLE